MPAQQPSWFAAALENHPCAGVNPPWLRNELELDVGGMRRHWRRKTWLNSQVVKLGRSRMPVEWADIGAPRPR